MKGFRIQITGVVQGVGFRPFVYNTAKRFNISGTVRNDVSGVDIHAAGEQIGKFITAIEDYPPPLARIDTFVLSETAVDAGDFIILESDGSEGARADVSVDTRTCDACLKELFDPNDRRYMYPFINCTDCGPRYTIVRDLPYDRPYTSMASFEMCPDCDAEYRDPADRRFHAQPNCCPACGPHYTDIDTAVSVLQKGGIVAIKGIGGYHLACDAMMDDAVVKMRELKDRDEKPFAVMARDPHMLDLTPAEQGLLCGPERPILLVDKEKAPRVSDHVSPGLDTLGVMLPYAPVHHVIFAKGGLDVLVMTSGNRSNEPMTFQDAGEYLADISDFILDHNRDIVVRNDDSVLRELAGEPVFLRRSRGYAPLPVFLDFDVDGMIGCGAMLKNSIAFGRGNKAYLSQYIGDLENEMTYASLEFTAGHLMKLFDMQPTCAVCDKHPDYLSTRFAESLGIELIRVQHHIAHARACLAENRTEQAVAVVYDGVGYGDDGNAWGGEIFSIDKEHAAREAHLSCMPMPGGDMCVRYPLRLAAGVLHQRGIEVPGMEAVFEIMEKNVHVYTTSAMGRLFDAVSALCGICVEQTYEGQAPMMLEAACAPLSGSGTYDVNGLNAGEILEQVYTDPSPADIRAARFHGTIIEQTARAVLDLAGRKGFDTVCFSGGCFQNLVLLDGLIERLKADLAVCRHRLVPPNDGCVALGQMAEAYYIRRNR